jgi:lantibiotic modifying enzyme
MLKPAALKSAISYGLELEQLSRSYLLNSEKPMYWPMLKAEIRQMEILDIPFFQHLIDSEKLPLSQQEFSIEGYIQRNGFDVAQNKIRSLTIADIDFQTQLIHGTIAARFKHNHYETECSETSYAHSTEDIPSDLLTSNLYVESAIKVADQLWDSAMCNRQGHPEWLGIDVAGDGISCHFGIVGKAFYSGNSGIAVLFARLAKHYEVLGDSTKMLLWRSRAWACVEDLNDMAIRYESNSLFRLLRDLHFGMAGSGGILLSLLLLQIAGIGDAATLSEQIISELHPDQLLADDCVDVLQGVSGLIGPLLMANTEKSKELAIVCGERILDLQLECGGWPQSIGTSLKKAPLTGFSHGASGICAALSCLANASGDTRFTNGVLKAIDYERSVFTVSRGNWPDFRRTNQPSEFRHGWCHGAPGIMLSRMISIRHGISSQYIDEDLQVARNTTLEGLKQFKRQEMSQANLCCGILGLVNILQLDAVSNSFQIPSEVTGAKSILASRVSIPCNRQTDSLSTVPVCSPGLFNGMAGIGLALLELPSCESWMAKVLSAGLY